MAKKPLSAFQGVAPTRPTEQSLASKIWSSVTGFGESGIRQVSEAAKAGVEKTTSGAQDVLRSETPLDAARAAVKTGAGVAETVSSPLAQILSPVGEAVSRAAQELEKTRAMQDIATSPDAGVSDKTKQLLEDINNVLATSGLFAGLIKAPEAIEGTRPPNMPKIEVPTQIKETIGKAKIRPAELLEDTQRYLSKANVSENLGTSVERLSQKKPKAGVGIKAKDPLKLYDEFYNQELKFKGDIKQDMAAGLVGERIGNAFERVAKQRRVIGEKLQSEIEKVGNIETDITESFPKLETELQRSGVVYDGELGKVVKSKTSKITSEDASLIENYLKELNELGANPTVAELDAFLSRVPKELDVFKSKNNITKVTNGERIIKGNLKELRGSLSPQKNPAFTEYAKARDDYASLSSFLDEGSSFLGKKTQAGDYAKDASLAKSSVQSILNQGKKDWLIKLEDLTGYPALDEAVLALQAMKDAGNPMGHSLLEIVANKPSLPTSPKGAAMQAAEATASFIKGKLTGTPAEQTRRMIEAQLKQKSLK